MTAITVEHRFRGLPDRGQGGYLAGRVATEFDALSRIDFRNPIPLDVALEHTSDDGVDRWHHDTKVIVERRAGDRPSKAPRPVSLEQATTARDRGEETLSDNIRSCFSCGTRPDSLRVHAGPVGDGRFATPYTPPGWTARNGTLEAPYVWAPVDCASGWAVTAEQPPPVAVTATLVVDVVGSVVPDETYVIVAEAEPEWRARRKLAWAALYSTDGDLLATAESLWVKLRST